MDRDRMYQHKVSLVVRYFMIPCNICLILLATSTLGFAVLLFLNNCRCLSLSASLSRPCPVPVPIPSRPRPVPSRSRSRPSSVLWHWEVWGGEELKQSRGKEGWAFR